MGCSGSSTFDGLDSGNIGAYVAMVKEELLGDDKSEGIDETGVDESMADFIGGMADWCRRDDGLIHALDETGVDAIMAEGDMDETGVDASMHELGGLAEQREVLHKFVAMCCIQGSSTNIIVA